MQKLIRRVVAFSLVVCMAAGFAVMVQAETHYVAESSLEQTVYISQDFENLTWAASDKAMGAGDAATTGGRWLRQSDDAASVKVKQLTDTSNATNALELYRDASIHKVLGVNVTTGVPASTAYELEFMLYRLANQGVTLTVGGKYAFIIYSAGQLRLYDNDAATWSSVTQMTVPADAWVKLRMAVSADGSYELTMQQEDGTVTAAADAGFISTEAAVQKAEFTCNTKGGVVAYLDDFKLRTTERVVAQAYEDTVHMAQGFDDADKFTNDILAGKTSGVYVYGTGTEGANWILYPDIVTVAQRAEDDQCILVRRLAGETGYQFTGNSATSVAADSDNSYTWSFDLKTEAATLMTMNVGVGSVSNYEASFVVGPNYIQSLEDTTAKVSFSQGQWVTVTVTVNRAEKTCTITAGDSVATFASDLIGTFDAARFSIWGRIGQANNYCYVDNVTLTEHVPVTVKEYELILEQNFDDTTVFNAENTNNAVGTAGTLGGNWSVSGGYSIVPTTEQYAGVSGQSMPLVRGGAAMLYGNLPEAPANTSSYEVEFKYYRKSGIGFTGTFFNEIGFHAVNDGRLLFTDGQLSYSYATGVSPVDQWVTVKLFADRDSGNYTITMLDASGSQLYSGTAKLAEGDDKRIIFNAQASIDSTLVAPYTSAYIDDVKLRIVQPRYDTLAAALTAAAEGECVKLTADHTEDQISIPAGVTLDLNGHALYTDSIAGFGSIIDSSDAAGVLYAQNILLSDSSAGLPLYDDAAGGYRFFAYELVSMPAKAASGNVVFGFTVEFANSAAYELMNDLDVQVQLAWDGMEGDARAFSFSQELITEFTGLVSKYPNMTVAMMLTVTGTDTLAVDSQVRVTPVITTGIGTGVSAEVISYTVPAAE